MSQAENDSTLIYKFDIFREIDKAAWRYTQKSFAEAVKLKADIILIHLNTYGGALDAADSIRTKILNSKIPVYVFIDNNAASAGALISIAADRIYMRKGANIGAATVVDQTGKVVPDKYQSFMRSMMRSTAESHGNDTIISGEDTIIRWKRDPKIAEAMVDPRTFIPGVNDTGKVLTLTTSEAIKYGYCEGEAENIAEVIELAGVRNVRISEYKISALDSVISFFLNTVVQSILIMLIVAGIYFELQHPGIGLPLFLALAAAALYFAPLYLEGLAQNWEILLFIAGLVLLALEIFVIPGFGVTGISGIALIIMGLTLSMVDNVSFKFDREHISPIMQSLFLVVISALFSAVMSIYLSSKLLTSVRSPFRKLVLSSTEQVGEGYISVEPEYANRIGEKGTTLTMLRPVGKISIGNQVYDAKCDIGFIEKGKEIIVTGYDAGQLCVKKL